VATLIWFVNLFVQLVTLVVIVQVFLSYFMSPYHPVRQGFDRVVEPMLRLIRKIVPPVGMFDFSPLILLILVQLLGKFLIELLSRLSF
jgi:YggT family protein